MTVTEIMTVLLLIISSGGDNVDGDAFYKGFCEDVESQSFLKTEHSAQHPANYLSLSSQVVLFPLPPFHLGKMGGVCKPCCALKRHPSTAAFIIM